MLRAAARQHGLTLVELMIAGAISLIALSAVLSVYSATARHGTQQLQSMQLHQQMFGILHLIGRDLRRAGYWQFEPERQSPADNPFQQVENRLRSGALAGEAADSCILLSYDLDRDGLVGVGQCGPGGCPPLSDSDNVEQFGFRLHDGNVQSRYAGSGLSCDSGYWQSLNEPDVRVTRLLFALHSRCTALSPESPPCDGTTPQLTQRVVSIDVDAQLDKHPETQLSLTQWITVRNDLLQEPAP